MSEEHKGGADYQSHRIACSEHIYIFPQTYIQRNRVTVRSANQRIMTNDQLHVANCPHTLPLR